jgi:Spy/CpxP family protein refolding chaperone
MRKIMWNNLRKPLLALSLGLNLAFVGVWLAHSISGANVGQSVSKTVADHSTNHSAGHNAIPSSLHREIGVTPEQWQQIEPIIRDFREKARTQRRKVTALRAQLMDLLSLPAIDETAIRAKQEEILAGQRQMQNLVIDHLLKEKKLLSPNQAKKLIQSLCEQCRREGAKVNITGGGFGRMLDEHSSYDRTMDMEKTK